jgi:hypothetical protein
VFVALCMAAQAPTESAPGIEVSGLGYYRTTATFALATTPANMAANVAAIEFPMALAAWGTVGYFELWDAQIGGNRLYWGQLMDPTSGVPMTISVASGDIVRFSPATLNVQAASGVGGTSSSPWLPTAGGTITPGNLAIGSGTGVPTLTLNGAAGANKGINWQNAGVNRWRFITDASDNLGLYAYGAGGAFIDTGLLFTQSTQTVSTNFRLTMSSSNATGANAVTGAYLVGNNTGANGANGHRFDYLSTAGSAGFDVGTTLLSIFDTAFIAGQAPAKMAAWIVAQSPNDTTNNWACIVGELNVVNRGADKGWMRDRTPANPTGGLLMVPEAVTFGGTGGGEGKNATFGYSVSRSAANNSTGFPVKFYNGYLIEPNSVAGLTGRGIYATGDITGTASQYPYGPLQLDGTWLHGIDHTRAVYTDSNAETLLVGQRLAWIVGATGAATATATIGASGSGANASLTLTTAGTGTVNLAVPPPNAANDAAAASAGVPVGGIYRNVSALQVRVV